VKLVPVNASINSSIWINGSLAVLSSKACLLALVLISLFLNNASTEVSAPLTLSFKLTYTPLVSDRLVRIPYGFYSGITLISNV
jgi:hypothetical protein